MKTMKTLFTFVVNVFLSVICWTMALLACARIGKFSWKLLKSTHGIMLGYKRVFWGYLNDEITEEEHDKLLSMYFLEI